ncbi:MAG: PAS domain S-box protein [Spirochaetia bacterium]|jgi:PAS domain S-box-containing protein
MRDDIPEHTARETEQASAMDTLRAIVDSLPLALITFSGEGRVLSWNPAAEHMFGWSEAEALQKTFPFVPPDAAGEAREILRATLAGGHVSSHETRHGRRDGSTISVSISTAPLRNPAGAVTGALWMAEDITARRLDEETIAEQARLLDFAQDAILVRGTDERMLYCNQATLRLYGYSREELRALNTKELVVDEDLPRFEEARRILALSGEWEGELRQRTRDGRILFVHSRWSLVRNNAGFPRGRLVISTDVSRQKEMETHLRRTQRMESLGTLASGIAHDLNNILSPILMAVEVLGMHAADARDRKMLGVLESSVHRGSDIVHQMLAFARGSEGELVPLSLRHVIREIETILRETFPKNISITTDVPKDLPRVRGDATRIHQVLINLCVNSRDALPKGGNITVTARADGLDETGARRHPGAKPGKYVKLSVIDDGLGIPEELHERIFEPFFTTKEKGKGTGLGLSTVQSVAQGHGGFVTCESEPGKGTRFDVYFPVVEQAAASGAEEPVSAIPLGAGETVLVIDDDQSILLITRQILESYDYKVLSANGGAAAVEALRERKKKSVSLVLTDMAMPSMDGAAAIQALRRIDPGVPVILMSGLPSSMESPEVAGLGIQGVIGKPFKSEDLLLLIREVIDRASSNARERR